MYRKFLNNFQIIWNNDGYPFDFYSQCDRCGFDLFFVCFYELLILRAITLILYRNSSKLDYILLIKL